MRRNKGIAMKRASAQAGRTMIETMIAMAIGVMVMGAVLNSVLGSSASARSQDSSRALTENGHIALGIIASHVRQAGYSTPRLNTLPGTADANYNGAGIRGCSGPFTNPGVADMAALGCGGAAQPDAIAVAYEADLTNTLAFGGGVPTDCLGRALAPLVSPLGGNYFVAENRFYVANGQLMCAGNGGAGFGAPQALLDGVEDMRIEYGVRDAGPGEWVATEYGNRVVRYRSAAQIDADPVYGLEPVMDRWLRAASADVCLLMASDDNVTTEPVPYRNCQGAVVTPADRRLRVAVQTTVSIRNTTAP